MAIALNTALALLDILIPPSVAACAERSRIHSASGGDFLHSRFGAFLLHGAAQLRRLCADHPGHVPPITAQKRFATANQVDRTAHIGMVLVTAPDAEKRRLRGTDTSSKTTAAPALCFLDLKGGICRATDQHNVDALQDELLDEHEPIYPVIDARAFYKRPACICSSSKGWWNYHAAVARKRGSAFGSSPDSVQLSF